VLDGLDHARDLAGAGTGALGQALLLADLKHQRFGVRHEKRMSDTLTPLRLAIVFLGLLLPTLALIPLGSLWLWQHGFLIHWALATLLLHFLIFTNQP